MTDWRAETYGGVAAARRARALDFPEVRNLLSVTAVEGVIDQAKSGRRDISADDKSKYLVVEPGDVVYNTMRMWQGVSGHSSLRGIVSPAYTVVRPNEGVLDGRFLAHQMKLPQNINLYRRYSQGLVSDTWNLKFSALAALPLSVPPLEEQRRIADILDTIDETIQATQRVIAKMEIRLTGLMQHTFGGSTWPSSLETVSVGSLLRHRPKNGKSPVESTVWRGTFMLGLGCLRSDGFAPEQLKFAPALDSSLSSALLDDGDLLMSRSNTRDRVGFVGRYQDVGAPCIYPDLMMRLSVEPDVSSRFLELALQSRPARRQIEAAASGTSGSMVKITGSTVVGLRVPLVPLQDQLTVSALFDEHGAAVAEERRKLAKIRQLRHGLAADLLSGRVRTVEA